MREFCPSGRHADILHVLIEVLVILVILIALGPFVRFYIILNLFRRCNSRGRLRAARSWGRSEFTDVGRLLITKSCALISSCQKLVATK